MSSEMVEETVRALLKQTVKECYEITLFDEAMNAFVEEIAAEITQADTTELVDSEMSR